MEERRLLLAVALSLLVLTAYQLLFAPAPPARPAGRPGAPSAASPSAPAAKEVPSPSPAPRATREAAPPVPPVQEVTDVRERRVEVQGADVLVAFSNRGGRLLSWRLERYTDARGRPEEMVP